MLKFLTKFFFLKNTCTNCLSIVTIIVFIIYIKKEQEQFILMNH